MSLSDDIRLLRDRVLTDLGSAHDYHNETQVAWQIVDRVVQGGQKLVIQNSTIGTVTRETDLVRKAVGYVAEELAEATFQQFMSIFESFLFDLLKLWLTAYPRNLIRKQVDFEEILDAPDKDAITQHVVEKELNDVMYRRPAEWFLYLESKMKLGCPTADEIGRIAEAKASRDLLVHNRGIAGKTYELKAGAFARCKVGERIKISEHYHNETWQLLRKVVADISDGCLTKVP